ncbi:hypothetical protein [Modicisalibacter tunisiensis]|uniref:Uncharacterized protein n=1 Tax=Modicisalibacter tunisiensis TaxID=390637 RepID=A0ABS7X3S9_9GAMM|nr:hypothetical protein [Modicisalibacter tunisiensis]MBZ9540511.1 hypothetical protein [Modicisalibacter tunisiensis]MBZ9569265.1 hypothetical protein [Modicisalibacter tunisiensis]
MKTIQLTHGSSAMELSEEEAVSLYNALSDALGKAGIDAEHHRTLQAPNGVQNFTRQPVGAVELTDC